MIGISTLILFASLAHGQSTATASVPLIDQIQISNLGKDTRDLLSGRYRQTGKPTFANGFCFVDATCQTTAFVGTASTQTILSADLRISNTMGVCYVSTVTFTTRAVKLKISLAGGEMVAPNASASFNVLMDGAFISPFTSSLVMQKFTNAANDSTSRPMSINFLTTSAVSAGSHSFCLTGESSVANGVKFDVSPGPFRVEEFQ